MTTLQQRTQDAVSKVGRDHLHDVLSALTAGDYETLTWKAPDGREVEFTEYRHELGWDDNGYTQYTLEFTLWPKTVKVSILAESSNPHAYDLEDMYSNTNRLSSQKVSHEQFGDVIVWVSEAYRVLHKHGLLSKDD